MLGIKSGRQPQLDNATPGTTGSCGLLRAEGQLAQRLFGDMLRRIWALPVPAA